MTLFNRFFGRVLCDPMILYIYAYNYYYKNIYKIYIIYAYMLL